MPVLSRPGEAPPRPRAASARGRARGVLVAFCVLVFALCGLARRELAAAQAGPRPGVPGTVVSLAPSITETVFALGAGERVVGVTRYCAYPPEAATRQRVGGYFDPNYEAILGLRPGLVILLEEHREARLRLEAAGLRTLAVDHTTIEGILESIPRIGEALGVSAEARALRDELRARIEAVHARTAGLPAPRVLVSIDRPVGGGAPNRLYVSGTDRHYNPLIEWAGGRNAYEGAAVAFPRISTEGLIRLDPDVIIDLIPPASGPETRLAARADWETLPELKAVRERRVHVWAEDFAMIPGPRFVRALEEIARALHPEAMP